jgi:hypothetical protein
MPQCVSVLMPVYNAEAHLHEAIESILRQTHRDIEFLILDDGSTDRSPEIAASFKDSRIRLIQNEANLKIVRTLNRGIELAQGDYMARMDSDDIADPERFATQLQFLQSHPDIAGVGARIRTTHGTIWKHPLDPQELFASNYFVNSLCHPTLFIRSEVLRDPAFRYDEAYLYAEEWELWFRIMRKYKLANVRNVLLEVRRFEQSSSSRRFRPEQIAAIFRLFHREWAQLSDDLTVDEIDAIVHHQSLGEPPATVEELRRQGLLLVQKAAPALRRRFSRRVVAKIINRQLYRLHTSAKLATGATVKAYLRTVGCAEHFLKPALSTGLAAFLWKRAR